MNFRLLFALLAALPLSADTSFPLGSGELGPVATVSSGVARIREGAGAVWTEEYGGASTFVRLDSTGAVIGAPIRLTANGAPCSNAVIASNARDALILCTAGGSTMAVRVSEDGLGEPKIIAPARYFQSLAWNGRNYVAVFSTNVSLAMMLLGPDGTPVGGTLTFTRPGTSYSGPSFACGDTRCLIAFAGNPSSVALIDESDFPAIGAEAELRLQSWPIHSSLAVGYDTLGFFTLTRSTYGVATLNRHGRLRGEYPDRLRTPLRSVTLNLPGWDNRVAPATQGEAIYVTSASSLYRVSGARVERFALPADVKDASALHILIFPSGPVVVRRKGSTQELYASRPITSANAPSTLVSIGRANEVMPRIARGTTTWLAAWLENRSDDDSLFIRAIDADGRPLTTAVRIAHEDGFIADAQLAFDGVNYLVLWQPDDRGVVRGRFVSQDGQPVGDAFSFELDTEFLTLMWSGSAYLLNGSSGIVRLSPSGMLLDSEPQLAGAFGNVLLARNPQSGRLEGLTIRYEGAIFGAGPNLYAHYGHMSIDDSVVPYREYTRYVSASYEQYAFWGDVIPAFAVSGNDYSLSVIDGSNGWEPGYLKLLGATGRLPYPRPERMSRKTHLHAHWTGRDFIVLAGETLARHAENGRLLGTMVLGADVVDSAGDDGSDAMLVVTESADHLIHATRVALPR